MGQDGRFLDVFMAKREVPTTGFVYRLGYIFSLGSIPYYGESIDSTSMALTRSSSFTGHIHGHHPVNQIEFLHHRKLHNIELHPF